MPWWLKVQIDDVPYPTCSGPFETEEMANQAKVDYDNPPEGYPVPEVPGEVVEGDEEYPHTLKHPVGKISIGDVDHIQYSDGTAEPVE